MTATSIGMGDVGLDFASAAKMGTARSTTLEHATITRRTRKAALWSVLAHLLLLLGLLQYQRMVPVPLEMTEITWLEPKAMVATAPPSAAAPSQPTKKAPVNRSPRTQSKQHFERSTTQADVKPRPQSPSAIQDRLRERLASLQRTALQTPDRPVAIATPTPVHKARAASLVDRGSTSQPMALTRSATKPAAPATLHRAAVPSSVPALAVAAEPKPRVEAAVPETDASAKRVLDGASLIGPVADRALLSFGAPTYPEWAKREGREASVAIHFVVLSDGQVKENVFVEKTSGYEEFDRNAMRALRQWRFEPLTGGAVGEQWGTITFYYRLSHANSGRPASGSAN